MQGRILVGTAKVSDAKNPGWRHVRLGEALEDAIVQAEPPQAGDTQTYHVKDILVEYGGIGMVTTTKVKIEVTDGRAPW
ncbi:MAG: hypothetical protein IT391_16835 [Nitrospira sp.]|nr:hypothetical protein [Nitrospira sp.]